MPDEAAEPRLSTDEGRAKRLPRPGATGAGSGLGGRDVTGALTTEASDARVDDTELPTFMVSGSEQMALGGGGRPRRPLALNARRCCRCWRS